MRPMIGAPERRSRRVLRRARLALTLGAALFATAAALAPPLRAAEWPAWRGPDQNANSPETGLISHWSQDGENLIWKVPLTARSTPIVFDGRVCINGRAGEGERRQERVACYDAGDGRLLWEQRFNVYHTAVPENRVGWANLAGDPETGYLYAQGVGGLFFCFDRAGKVVWSRNLVEELGFFSGYGGRTQTPVLDGERLIVTFVSGSWGELGPPRHRLFAFDKKSGELIWVSTPGGAPADLNTQTTPVVATIDGRRLAIGGNADGWVYAVDARTGEKVWGFHLSMLALNTTVAVGPDGTVFAAHAEENVDSPEMGGVVAFSGRGRGDITASNLKWRAPIEDGFPSPTLHDGTLYVIDNSANLFALDAATGERRWTLDLGTVGKGSPVVADGKLFATEVNGRFHVVEPGAAAGKILDSEELHMPDGRYAEIYGSPAIAYGRIYLATENALYCLGDRRKPFRHASSARPGSTTGAAPAAAAGAPTKLLVVPAEVGLRPGEAASFRVLAFDALGNPVAAPAVTWSLKDLTGSLDGGRFTPDAARGTQLGQVVAKAGELTAAARARVIAPPPYSESFDSIAVGQRPAYFLSGAVRFEVVETSEGKVLRKGPAPEGVHRHRTFLGLDDWSDYTIQADLMAEQVGRKLGDVGLIDSGYTVDLMGSHQQIQVRSWDSELRASKQVPFSWQPGTWYTMKVSVRGEGGKAVVRAKVWPRGQPEPAEWTLVAEDPLPIAAGSPGLYGYSPAPVYYDNVAVTKNP
ncbi:MAG TPA: PQQ-binding-like beta-propeller repeat protein [Thermoanaerobaculia bacterium]|nr:PQQ-binding-like beta-propeller repeat protein [Thermoanaerobaculia bacterium]